MYPAVELDGVAMSLTGNHNLAVDKACVIDKMPMDKEGNRNWVSRKIRDLLLATIPAEDRTPAAFLKMLTDNYQLADPDIDEDRIVLVQDGSQL